MSMGATPEKEAIWKRLAETGSGLSYAEVIRAAEEVLKEALIHERERVTEYDIRLILLECQDLGGRHILAKID